MVCVQSRTEFSQKTDLEKIIVSTMQKNTIDLLSTHYPDQNIRVKYIPIEWHSDIHSVVDSKINKTTLNTVPKVRLTTNDWLMDCLYCK